MNFGQGKVQFSCFTLQSACLPPAMGKGGWVAKPARWVAKPTRWVAKPTRWVAKRARWVAKPARWVAKRARWVAKRARWVAKRARWVAKRARWVAKRARWVAKHARWVAKRARLSINSYHPGVSGEYFKVQNLSCKDWTENGHSLIWISSCFSYCQCRMESTTFMSFKHRKLCTSFTSILHGVCGMVWYRISSYAHCSPQTYMACVAWCGIGHQSMHIVHLKPTWRVWHGVV